MQTAIILGATGLVGTELLKQVLEDPAYDKVKVLGRRSILVEHAKMEQILVDFDQPATWADKIRGDVLFSAFGTTLKKAGSKEKQYAIDFTYQYEVAKAAAANGVSKCVLVSSAGANAQSKLFYNRMKGELDAAVANLSFENVSIIRPSFLDGNRIEKRTGEKIALVLFKFLYPIIPGAKKYRPIAVSIVAKAMLKAVRNNTSAFKVYELEQVFELAASNS